MMQPHSDLSEMAELDYEEWRVLVRSLCGQYNPEGIEPENFAGWMRPQTICGFEAVDLSCNAHRVERTHGDVRLDGMDFYYAAFQFGGHSAMTQNDHVVELDVGDVVLVDSTRPMTYFGQNKPGRWLALHLPRQALISHLGTEPQGGLWRPRGTLASRLLFDLVRDAVRDRDAPSDPIDPDMQLVIYDLLGALFAPHEPVAASLHADKLFTRICDIVRDGFAEPEFGPCEVAAQAGISLRYLQKFFTARGTTCTHFINSVRLDHAAYLLHRRATLNTGQPISGIAYDSGVSDYTHFARIFRRRFGHSPGAHAGTPLRSGAPPYG
jgi:AraC-like DNA-binding protein